MPTDPNSQNLLWSLLWIAFLAISALVIVAPCGHPHRYTVLGRDGNPVTGAFVRFRWNPLASMGKRALALLGLLVAAFAVTEKTIVYIQTQTLPSIGIIVGAVLALIAMIVIFSYLSYVGNDWIEEITVGGAPRTDASVHAVDGDTHAGFRIIGALLAVGLGCVLLHYLVKDWPAWPLSGHQSKPEIVMPVAHGQMVRWHKEDQRKVSFPVLPGIRWFIVHDKESKGRWIETNTSDPSQWTVELQGGRHVYTYHANLTGVSVGYVTDKERTQRVDQVPR